MHHDNARFSSHVRNLIRKSLNDVDKLFDWEVDNEKNINAWLDEYLDSRERISVEFRRRRIRENVTFVEEKVPDFVEHFRSEPREVDCRTIASPSRGSPNAKSSDRQSNPSLN